MDPEIEEKVLEALRRIAKMPSRTPDKSHAQQLAHQAADMAREVLSLLRPRDWADEVAREWYPEDLAVDRECAYKLAAIIRKHAPFAPAPLDMERDLGEYDPDTWTYFKQTPRNEIAGRLRGEEEPKPEGGGFEEWWRWNHPTHFSGQVSIDDAKRAAWRAWDAALARAAGEAD